MASQGKKSNRHRKGDTQGSESPNIQAFLSKDRSTADISSDVSRSPSKKMASDDGISKQFFVETLQQHTDDICARIDLISQQVSTLTNRVDGLEQAVEHNDKRIADSTNKMATTEASLKLEVESLRESLLLTQTYSRKRNLLVFGIPNDKMDVLGECTKLFVDFLEMAQDHVDNMRFVNYHRLPRMPGNGNRDEPTPIILKFVSMIDRNLVMDAVRKHGPKLRKSRLGIRTDLPPQMKQLRGQLLAKAYKIRAANKGLQTRVNEKGTSVFLQYRVSAADPWKSLGLHENIQI